MFDSLPTSALDAMDWSADDFRPYYENLFERDIDGETITKWLQDWSAIESLASEIDSRIYVATTVNTADTVAEARYERFNAHVMPELYRLDQKLKVKFVESGFQPVGFDVPLRNLRSDVEIYHEDNVPLVVQENLLSLEYDKIVGSQTVEWDGEERTLAQMSPIQFVNDRTRREQAWRLVLDRTLQDRDALNGLWVKYMDLRGQQASNVGFGDYRAYRWKLLKRFDYSPDDSATFHDAIEQVVVPAATRLYEKRRQQLGVDTLRPWDLYVDTHQRDALRPFETITELETKLENIFQQVDPILGQYFATMRRENLLDLDNRKNKAPGAYCTPFMWSRRPYIFMNAVGLHDDVQTLLHESGHAFHVFEFAHLPYTHQGEVPMEFAEVASMAMELLGAPYLNVEHGGYYSEGDAARARAEHLAQMITFWPYMAVVDAFQHWVYTNHSAASDPANCDATWAKLWDRFMPGIDYSGLDAAKMTGWHRKLHIFQLPFYYIEYGLAQLGAVQVWANALNDQSQAVADYRTALALGGTATLPALFSAAGARFAFDADTLAGAVDLVERTLVELETV